MPSWAFEMIDRLSGPAMAADRALEALDKQTRANKLAVLELNSAQLRSQQLSAQGFKYDRIKIQLLNNETQAQRILAAEVARDERFKIAAIKSAAKQESDLIKQMDRERKASAREQARLTREQSRIAKQAAREQSRALAVVAAERDAGIGRFRTALAGVAAGVMALGAGVAAAGVALGVSTAQAASFGEAQRRLLQQQFGAVEGARQYQILLEYSNRYGTSVHDTMEQFQSLTRAGFNQPQVIAMMQQIGDVATTMGGDTADGVTLAISQIMASNRIQKQDLNQLAQRGVSLGSIYSALGDQMHVSAGRARDLLDQSDNGGISKMQFMSAVVAAMNKNFSQGGLAGTAMRNRLQTLPGVIDLIKARWEGMQTRVGETGAFQPVTDFLGKVADMMDANSESGKKFQGILNDLFTGLFGKAGKQDPVKMFKDIADGIKTAWAFAKDFFGVLGTILEVIRPIVHGLKLISDVKNGRPIASSELGGRSMDASLRGVRGGGMSNEQIAAYRALGETPTAAQGGAAALAPTRTANATALAAGRNVNVGDINVTVAGNVDSGGMTPAEVGAAAGQATGEHLNRSLDHAAASLGNPT